MAVEVESEPWEEGVTQESRRKGSCREGTEAGEPKTLSNFKGRRARRFDTNAEGIDSIGSGLNKSGGEAKSLADLKAWRVKKKKPFRDTWSGYRDEGSISLL
jgi:hypothetical protein